MGFVVGGLWQLRRGAQLGQSPRHPPGRGAKARSRMLSEVAAVQEMVRQLHAMVYGYQLAIGKLRVLSKTASSGRARALLTSRVFRDRLIARLRKRSAEVPAAEPAYVPSVVPRNAATAGKLIMRMHTALQPFCGLWLAAAESQADRTQALSALGSEVKIARSWGAPARRVAGLEQLIIAAAGPPRRRPA